MKRLKKLILGFMQIVFTVMLLLLLAYNLAQVLPPHTALRLIGFKPFIVATDSMTGLYDVMDGIIVRYSAPQDLKAGDVIVFYTSDDQTQIPYTHIIASIDYDGEHYQIRTKPNTSIRWDAWTLNETNIIGAAWFRIPKLGYYNRFLKDPILIGGFLTTLFFFIALWIAFKGMLASQKENHV